MKNNTTVNNKQQKQNRGFILLYQRNLAHPLSSSLALRSALLIGSTLALSHFALSPTEVVGRGKYLRLSAELIW